MKQKLLLLLITLLIAFSITEITFTILVDEDLDGNFSLNYVHLKPFKLPILETEKKVEELIQHKIPDSLIQQYEGKNFKREYFNVRLIPDSLLGWSPNPYYKSSNELYLYNKDGIRSKNILTDYSKKSKLRIAFFGDSYSHGDEVKFKNTIGEYLQTLLNKDSIDAEVINFAVSGYGMDQALLRWEEVKDQFQPDIVILGVQFENAKRHINLLRPFYYYITEIPYAKPRFVISGNKLLLVKNPISDIANTAETIKNIDDWKFSHFEGFYDKENYESNLFYLSKSVSFVSNAISQIFGEIDFYKPESESYQVTYKIFEQFKNSVEENNKIFIPVHLPVKNDLDFLTAKFLDIMYSQKFIYDELFSALKLKATFVETFDTLEKWELENETDNLFMKRHYSPTANKIIANQIYDFLKTHNQHLLKPSERKE
ncbi:MAG: SGNH/GDSL hydrolase family protein [Melioribacteraceae bacterium]|jgi:hypothetical protein|nr:SGNH/GDSL hydrolase family protein [Melioribacteraceae bacterium]